ncbi:MAG: 2-C-methyl-D-erythritol 4-phosphate cytidylyltransferase [Gaiellales bacterium]
MTEAVGTWAIVVAAGEGSRLGADRPKAFVGFAGRVLLAPAVELMEDHPAVDGVVVVVPAGWEEPATLLAEELVAGKVRAAVAGGATRAQSVAAGLDEVPGGAGVVLVHDAARPLASAGLVSRVLEGLATGADGVVPALPVPDTIKRVDGDAGVDTVDRSQLRAVQTPQGFLADSLRRAYAGAGPALDSATDCASLLEAAGMRVVTVPGERTNVKVTEPSDLRLAEALR